jgi:hypothetical protein
MSETSDTPQDGVAEALHDLSDQSRALVRSKITVGQQEMWEKARQSGLGPRSPGRQRDRIVSCMGTGGRSIGPAGNGALVHLAGLPHGMVFVEA